MKTRSKALVGSRPSSRGPGPLPTPFMGITNEICLTDDAPTRMSCPGKRQPLAHTVNQALEHWSADLQKTSEGEAGTHI